MKYYYFIFHGNWVAIIIIVFFSLGFLKAEELRIKEFIILPFNKYLLSFSYMPGTVLGDRINTFS